MVEDNTFDSTSEITSATTSDLILTLRNHLKLGNITQFDDMYQIEDHYENSDKLTLQLLRVIYLFEIGNGKEGKELFHVMKDVYQHLPEADSVHTHLKLFTNARYLEYEQNYEEAIEIYATLEDLIEGNKDIPERSSIYYHYGRILKFTGNLDRSIHYFKKAISIHDEKDNHITAESLNHIGETLLKQGNFELSSDYLWDAMDKWNTLSDSIGKTWALYNLGILHALWNESESENALKFLSELYEMSQPMSPLYASDQLLYLFLVTKEAGHDKLAGFYFKALKDLGSNNMPIIQKRISIAKKIANLRTNYREKKQDPSFYASGENYSDIGERFLLMVIHLELLLEELEFVHDQAKSKISSETVSEIFAQYKNLLLNPTTLAVYFNSSRILYYIDWLEGHAANQVINGLEKLNSTIHSIPRLKVLIALQMRIKLAFSELVKITNLSRGSVFNICEGLEKQDIIVSTKEFQDERLTTFFSLSNYGTDELKEYITKLNTILSNIA